ncbi:MAG TPA: arginase family protein, partial [Actinomycetota bacterium]|nr:arginase family protein [Actinomycetota bacterium]
AAGGALDRFTAAALDPPADIRAVAVADHGDLTVADARPEEALEPVASAIGRALADADVVVVLGGDNSVTRPGVRGVGPDLDAVALLTLDAHVDFRATDRGMTNGNPVRALVEDGLPGRNIVQVGIQSFANSPTYLADAGAAGVGIVGVERVRDRGIDAVIGEALDTLAARAGAVYVDLDLDVLDAAFAPACPGARPGGLAPWDLRRAARRCGAHPAVRALDLVEIDPERDPAGATSLVAASCLLEFAAGVAARSG